MSEPNWTLDDVAPRHRKTLAATKCSKCINFHPFLDVKSIQYVYRWLPCYHHTRYHIKLNCISFRMKKT